MTVFVPTLKLAQTQFRTNSINPSDHWSGLVTNFPALKTCVIYHRMDVPHQEFLDYPAFLSEFEMIVCRPDHGIVLVHSGTPGSATDAFCQNLLGKFQQQWKGYPFKLCYVDKTSSGRQILQAASNGLQTLRTNYNLNPKFDTIIEYLNKHLEIMALPPEKLSCFGEFLESRFIRIAEKSRVFQIINDACAKRAQHNTPIRLYLDGSAGCGKTIGALHLYRELSKQKVRPLLLCFNHFLGRSLEKECKGHEGFASTVFNFAHQVLIESGLQPKDSAANHLSILRERLAYGELKPKYKFGALIVDEGQDFHKDWLELIVEHFLVGGDEVSGGPHVAWFEDGRQSIRDRGTRVGLPYLNNLFPGICTPGRILLNLRNPARIVSYGTGLLERICSAEGIPNPRDLASATSDMEGISPCDHSCKDEDDLREQVEERVEQLRLQGLDMSQIRIVSCRNTEKGRADGCSEPSSFLEHTLIQDPTTDDGNKKILKYSQYSRRSQERLDGQDSQGKVVFPVEYRRYTGRYKKDFLKEYLPEHGIPCDDIFKVKGMEFLAVILVDIERPDGLAPDQWMQRLYCAITRATYSLDVFYLKGRWGGKEDAIFINPAP